MLQFGKQLSLRFKITNFAQCSWSFRDALDSTSSSLCFGQIDFSERALSYHSLYLIFANFVRLHIRYLRNNILEYQTQITEEGSENRSNKAICTPTKRKRLSISSPDIQAQIVLTSSLSGCCWRSIQRLCAYSRLARIYWRANISLVWFLCEN